jgi:hypothetical protein
MAKKGIYKFYWNCGRMGDLSSVFVAAADAVAAAIGKEVYFGEVLGKHSEVGGTLAAEDITLASDDPSAVSVVESLKLSVGLNPLSYLSDSDEEDEEA